MKDTLDNVSWIFGLLMKGLITCAVVFVTLGLCLMLVGTYLNNHPPAIPEGSILVPKTLSIKVFGVTLLRTGYGYNLVPKPAKSERG